MWKFLWILIVHDFVVAEWAASSGRVRPDAAGEKTRCPDREKQLPQSSVLSLLQVPGPFCSLLCSHTVTLWQKTDLKSADLLWNVCVAVVRRTNGSCVALPTFLALMQTLMLRCSQYFLSCQAQTSRLDVIPQAWRSAADCPHMDQNQSVSLVTSQTQVNLPPAPIPS